MVIPSYDTHWSTLPIYQSTQAAAGDSFILYGGGPVRQVDWIPVPLQQSSQYLAVLCKRDASEIVMHSIGQSEQCCSLQIWMIEKLPLRLSEAAKTLPTLVYCVAYDLGPVLTWAFCPSGAFSEDRLGLVAMPTRAGDVHVIALPRTIDGDHVAPMLRVDPVLILTFRRRAGHQKGDQITKIAWSKVRRL